MCRLPWQQSPPHRSEDSAKQILTKIWTEVLCPFKESLNSPNVSLLPVERPFEQELACSFREARAALVRFQDLRDHVVEPGSPLVQRALLLQGDFKVLLQTLNHTFVTLTHPRCLLLLDTTDTANHIQQETTSQSEWRSTELGFSLCPSWTEMLDTVTWSFDCRWTGEPIASLPGR